MEPGGTRRDSIGLDEAQIAGFHRDGFLVLRGCLSAQEQTDLTTACERALTLAQPFRGRAETRVLMFAEDAEPALAGLVAHPRIMAAMRAIWGRPCLYLGSYLWSNAADTPWHTAGRPGDPNQIIRVTANLDRTTAEDGALHVIPGTHRPDPCRSVYDELGYEEGKGHRLRVDGRAAPGAISIETQPGDVILFWNRMWHGAWARRDGRPRRAHFLSYVPDPLDDEDLIQRLRDSVAEIVCPERPALYAESVSGQNNPDIAWMLDRLQSLTGRAAVAAAVH